MKRFSHLLLDVEGTIVLDKKYRPVPGAVKWFNSATNSGVKARIVTNNTTESPHDLYKILRNKGFVFPEEDFFTCLTEAVAKMHRRGVKSCLVLGVEAVKKYLNGEGIRPLNSPKVDSVLVGLDPTLTYRKMNLAVKAIVNNGARLYTLHRNRRFVNENRETVMSSGPVAAALENACLVRATVCGKPDKRFFLSTIKGWDAPLENILMVSDDPFADLVGAKKIGMRTCWVLTGSQKDKLVAKKIPQILRPDYILKSVVEIPF